jgi:hypothetical protein
MISPQAVDEGYSLQIQIWRVAVNILNEQLRTANKGHNPVQRLGGELTTPLKINML